MNTGLAILIARTKTHPEEFISDHIGSSNSRWVNMMENFTQYMTDEERAAWQEAIKSLEEYKINKRRDDFTEEVMKELAGVGDEDGVSLTSVSHNNINPVTSKIRMQGSYSVGWTDPKADFGKHIKALTQGFTVNK